MGAHDNLGVYSDAQAITDAAYSTNFIDHGVTKPQLGVGSKRPVLCIRTNTAPTQAADTLSIELRKSATNDGTNLNGTVTTVNMPLVGAAGAEVVASDARLATAGAWICRLPLPFELDQRYSQLYYNNTTSNGTFVVDAWLEYEPASDHGVQVIASPVGNP